MAITVSPSVQVREFDLTTVVPAVSQTPGAIAGVFKWGPVSTRVLIDSENNLKTRFGAPTSFNAETWFTAANFLSYGGTMWAVRAGQSTGNLVIMGGSNTFTTANANTSIVTANTTGLVAGQILLYTSNNTNLNPATGGGITIASVTNGTVVVLSSAPVGADSALTAYFRDPVIFSAAAQEVSDLSKVSSNAAILNPTDYTLKDTANSTGYRSFDTSIQYIARYPGALGNSLRVSHVDTSTGFNSTINVISNTFINATASYINAVSGSANLVITVTGIAPTTNGSVANAIAGSIASQLSNGDLIQVGNSSIGFQFIGINTIGAVTNTANVYTINLVMDSKFNRAVNVSSTSFSRYWEFFNLIQVAPGQSTYVTQHGNTSANDELHVVVVDQGGLFTKVPGTVLEVYQGVSRANDAKLDGGLSNYYKDIINQKSQYIWWANDRTTAPCTTAALISSASNNTPLDVSFYGGADGLPETTVPLGTITNGYDLFQSAEDVDVGLVMQGKARGLAVSSNTNLATYLINNLAETRKDCVIFTSPDQPLVVGNPGLEASSIVTARNAMPSTSYGFMESGYKYQYDKYNDVWRWIPLNGDMAGLAARCDQTNDPWWSFAGFNRGNIKNVGKLAWNPRQSERDTLYASGVNSVASFPGLGTVLFGDKTLLGRPSAFDRINVRRLFITLEKAIATAAKFTLFDFNDPFTRSQFKAMVNPYLADIKGKRGIQNFLVICDATNNTPEVIDANQFKAAIYIKPARSINWIILDFVAVPTGVAFNEVIGQYGG